MKKSIFAAIAICAFAMSCATSARALDLTPAENVPEAKAKLIRQLINQMKMDETMKQVSAAIIERMKTQAPDMFKQTLDPIGLTAEERSMVEKEVVPGYVEKTYKSIFAIFDVDSLINKIYVPIYAKHFSDDDIKAMIAFYDSPVGKKLVAESPAIATESMNEISVVFIPQLAMSVKNITEELKAEIKKRVGK
ncbi:MAG: DUF2059 domain-containing protein [bacterium]